MRRWRDHERRSTRRTVAAPDGPRHHFAAGAAPPEQAIPSALALVATHLPSEVGERGAPGIGFGE